MNTEPPAALPAGGLPEWLEPLPHGIYAIDTGFERPRFDAAYLIVHHGRAAFVDTGTAFALPRLLGALAALGLERDAVDWVIPTHVHLDHAGGVGQLMRELPQAKALVHPRGVRHIVNPRMIWEAASAVYGADVVARSYGELLPVPAERVQATAEGMVARLADRVLEFADTPGHAKHHHCVWDEVSRGWFTGDTFGLSYREFDTARGPWIAPTSVPSQFQPDVLAASIRRLLARGPECMYLTHYGRVGDVPRLGAQLLDLLAQLVALGRREQHHPQRHEALKRGQLDLFDASLTAHGCTLGRERLAKLMAIDLELNAQGMAIWLEGG
ncbi:MAG: MBL fold metallo-hydrolase [Rubrivivax sp.]|nr:MBL fold metallo-hydrolase [Rubrivivax sp.]